MNLTRRHFCGLAGGALASFCGGCAVNPATGEQQLMLVSAEDERRIGATEHPKLIAKFGGAYDEPGLAGYIAAIGGRLASTTETPGLRFTFTVLDSPIVNAMALPGGYVYITRGLLALAQNEAEIAGVLGHEIGHVVARHTAQRLSQAQATQFGMIGLGILGQLYGVPSQLGRLAGTAAGLYLQGFSREQELEADTLGIRYMTRTGYSADGMASFLGQLQSNTRLQAAIEGRPAGAVDAFDFRSTHPRTIDRLHRALAAANVARSPARTLGRDPYLRAIDGMVFGHDPDDGVIRGREFLHRALAFRFAVPEGFRLINRPDLVAARGPEGRAAIRFDLAPRSYRGSMTAYIARAWTRGAGINELEAIEVNGMAAATGWLNGRSRQGPVEVRLVAIRLDARHIYRFTFIAPPWLMRRLTVPLQRVTYSFHRLTRAEAEAITPRRLQIIRAGEGDTSHAMARQMAVDGFQDGWFEVLNGLPGAGSLAPRQLVKMVVV